MPHWLTAVRWVHVIAATSWFGEVLTINLVLVPAVARMSLEARGRVLTAIFPRIFRLASVLSATAVGSGAVLYYMRFHAAWKTVVTTHSGLCFTVAGALAILLTLFHFFAEPRLGEMVCVAGEQPDGEVATRVMKALQFIPRAGLGVMTVIILLMMVGARGY